MTIYRRLRQPVLPLSAGTASARPVLPWLLLVLGGGILTGWGIRMRLMPATVQPTLRAIADFDPAAADSAKILLHLDSMEPQRGRTALDITEQILRRLKSGWLYVRA